jgi:hypothetical protein
MTRLDTADHHVLKAELSSDFDFLSSSVAKTTMETSWFRLTDPLICHAIMDLLEAVLYDKNTERVDDLIKLRF